MSSLFTSTSQQRLFFNTEFYLCESIDLNIDQRDGYILQINWAPFQHIGNSLIDITYSMFKL